MSSETLHHSSSQAWPGRPIRSDRPIVHSLHRQREPQRYIICTLLHPTVYTRTQPHNYTARSHTRLFSTTSNPRPYNRIEKTRSRPISFTINSQSQQKLNRSTTTSTHTAMESSAPVRAPKHLTVDLDSSPEVSDISSRTTAASTPAYTPEVLASQLAKYNLTEGTLFQVQDVFIELVEAAGIMMVNAEHDVLAQAATKNNTSDLVSDYDKAIERMVQKRLQKDFPDFGFLGEESYKHGQKLTDGPTFIVDPVDGTINFTRGFHNFAISLCLAIEKKPIVGVVYSPKLGKLFTAVKTHGAFLVEEVFVPRKNVTDPLELKVKNSAFEEVFGKISIEVDGKTAMPAPVVEKANPISLGAKFEPEDFRPTFKAKLPNLPKYKLPLAPIPPPMPSLQKRLVAIEWGNERKGPNWDLRTDVHTKLLTSDEAGGKMILSCRSSGSAALDFCYVAAGMFDAFWEGGVWVWDVAAGWLIVEEAGGIVASANPGDWHPTMEGRTYFPVRGAKREEQEAVVKELWEVMGDRKFIYKDKKKPEDGTVSAAETA